jgi:hypothetical protein
LTVYRRTADGYLVIRAEPFDAIELHVGSLLGDDDDTAAG